MLVFLVQAAFVSPDVQCDMLRDKDTDTYLVVHRRPFLVLWRNCRSVRKSLGVGGAPRLYCFVSLAARHGSWRGKGYFISVSVLMLRGA
jgi:hypothetical protein